MPPPRPHVFAPLEVTSVQVDTRITGQVAVTTIHQEFHNPNPTQMEGSFLFPVPKGAHLDKFTMEMDGKPVEAELLSAEKARQIYEDIVRKLKDPALLEYAGRDVFKVRIFPIEARGKKRITLTYTQMLTSDSGLVSFTLPLNTDRFSAQPVKNLSVKVRLEHKQPIKSIYSPTHPVEIKRDGPNRATVGFEGTGTQTGADFALYFAPEKDELGLNLMAYRTGDQDGYFLLLASPGSDVSEKNVVKKDVAFVLDTSGSMAGKKLEQAKKALLFCIENLNEGDRFEIIRFSTEVEPVFEKLVEVTSASRARAEGFVKELKPIGGTAIDEAMKKALSLHSENGGAADRPFMVIFLTDGRPTIGTTDEDQILAGVKKVNAGRTRVFCFGIGTDVNTHLLDKITAETRGLSQYVLPEEDLEVKVSNFYAKIKEPVLANPTLKFNGDARVTKLYPSPLPDLFKGEQLVLVGRYSGKGDAAIVLAGMINGQPHKFIYEATFPETARDHEFIPRLWATRRVGYLMDEIRLNGENAELKEEVTELARHYGIVTPYTAYLIVEDETRRNVPATLQSMQRLQTDREARDLAARNYSDFKAERGGTAGVAGARYGLALKSAMAPEVAAVGGEAESFRALGLPAAPTSIDLARMSESSAGRLAQYSQQAQFVAGKNFFQNDRIWVDAAAQQAQNSRRMRIQFASTEYFELAAKEPSALPWLALGQNVQFVLKDTLYEIYE